MRATGANMSSGAVAQQPSDVFAASKLPGNPVAPPANNPNPFLALPAKNNANPN